MVIAVGSQPGKWRSIPTGGQFSILLLWSLCAEPVGNIKFNFVGWDALVVSEQYVVITPGLTGVTFCSWFYSKKSGCRVWPRFLLVSGINQGNEEARWVLDFFV